MPFDLDWQGDDIPRDLEEPFYQANEVLGRRFTQEITSRKWSWPVSPTPRDIVDFGQFRSSQESERGRDVNGPYVDHSWPTAYAIALHEGYVTRGGSRMPGRPWTKEPVEDGTLPNALETLARRRFE